jgi:hypothetical protein
LNLLIEGPPALVDFGANSTVYAALKPGQRIALSAAPQQGWFVHLGDDLYASGMRSRAEGWVHVMDKQRATAIAIAGFGSETRDRIEVSPDGAPNDPPRFLKRRRAQSAFLVAFREYARASRSGHQPAGNAKLAASRVGQPRSPLTKLPQPGKQERIIAHPTVRRRFNYSRSQLIRKWKHCI